MFTHYWLHIGFYQLFNVFWDVACNLGYLQKPYICKYTVYYKNKTCFSNLKPLFFTYPSVLKINRKALVKL